jgi:dolichol-phosphate mannosyltransferase
MTAQDMSENHPPISTSPSIATPNSDELLTVIVPALDEERTLPSTITEILDEAKKLPVRVEVLMIDDGSTDGTRARMEALCDQHSACKMRVNERNLGVGRSVLDSYDTIDPDSWATVLPADNEIVFRSVWEFLRIRDQYDIILGYLRNPVIRPFRRRLASVLFTRTVNFLFGFEFRYINGMKLYRVSAFRGIEVAAHGHAFNAELLAKAILRNPELRIGEAPFIARGRPRGQSKAIRLGSITRAVWEVFAGMRRVSAYRREILAARVLEQ